MSQPVVDRYAWGVSIVLHVVCACIGGASWSNSDEMTQTIPDVPVQLVFTPKPVPNPSVNQSEAVSKKTLAPSIEKKPMPGDRPSAEVASRQSPTYPKIALNNNWEGRVTIRVFISESGTIGKIRVLESSGKSILDNAFIRTIKQFYTFKPKREMGKNIADTMDLAYEFKLGE